MLVISSPHSGLPLATNVAVASSFFLKLKGLLGKRGLADGEGLLLPSCNAVHTFFMKFPIDVLFLDRSNTVIHAIFRMPPFRISPVVRHAVQVFELPEGKAEKAGVKVNDQLLFVSDQNLFP